MKHVVVFSAEGVKKLLDGKLEFEFKFFKKKPEFLNELSVGDIVFFRRKQGDVLGQFEVGKLIIIERLEIEDWRLVEQIAKDSVSYLSKEKFRELADINQIMLIIRIEKLEQFITSPIEIDKRSKKEWRIISEE